MVELEPGRNEKESGSVIAGRKPWSTPALTVRSVTEVTRGGTDDSKNDGVTNFAAVS